MSNLVCKIERIEFMQSIIKLLDQKCSLLIITYYYLKRTELWSAKCKIYGLSISKLSSALYKKLKLLT